ncbi:MAG: hypothetical protein ACE5JQ_05435 [Candidatus Methylomirabilales bacterium]
MSHDGKNIIAMMQQLRRLCEQISLLLSTADTLMDDEGWKATGNTPVLHGISYSLQWPRYWIPQDFFRFYKNDNLRHILTFVSVVLDDRENEKNLMEPLLTAGWFDYGPGNEVGNRWDYPYARWHLKMPERSDDGKLLSAAWTGEHFLRVSTLGVPLTSIADVEGLKSKIIEPLIKGMKETQRK